jgi:lipid-A-disaccharide synthase
VTAPGRPTTVFLSAFEPSGDDLAAAVIRALRAQRRDLKLIAVGGPKMAEAGADVLEITTENPVMGLPGLRTIIDHMELNERIAGILADRPIDLHVPTDSPAANFPLCKITRAMGARIVHVVAPQMWAWGAWRVRKLRRLTDLVLCLLPFEPEWFAARGVPAEFVGHPMFDDPLEPGPEGDPDVVALLPGSRSKEFQRVFPLQLEILAALRRTRPGLKAVVAAVSAAAEQEMRDVAARTSGWPPGAEVVVADVDAAIARAGFVIACSGTVSLRVARHRRPMIVVYRVEPVGYALIGRRLIASELRALPNLAAGRRIVPEFIPLEGPAAPAIAAAERLLASTEARAEQVAELDRIARLFESRTAANDAAARILAFLDQAMRPEHAP